MNAAPLKSWYESNRRILPWREDPTPFHVWISEIMLQQTRASAVIGYYNRFLAEVPDIRSLAAIPEDRLLKLWEGLGYYSRAKNLKKAATYVTEHFDGELPHTAKELSALPGIGPYTAAAIASIAFGETEIALDGNLLRVFARLTAYTDAVKTPAAKREAEAFFREMLLHGTPEENAAAPGTTSPDPECAQDAEYASDKEYAPDPEFGAGAFNQALMDLGATVCLPNGAPLCECCPFASDCLAHREGNETAYPVPDKKKPRRIEQRTVLLIRYDGKVLLQKRTEEGLLAGLYEFPNIDGSLSDEEALAHAASLGFSALRIRALPPAKHIFTHKEWHMTGYEILADELVPPVRPDTLLVFPEELAERYALPSALSKYRAFAIS